MEKTVGPVTFLPGPNKGKYPNCHSIYIEGPGILVDPASDRERLARLRRGPGVKEVWLSHWHEDHFMHLDLFDDLPFRIAAAETPPLADAETFMDWYGIDIPAFREYWRKALVDTFNFKPRSPAATFSGGETIAAGGLHIDVIHTPGHTPGHMAFHIKEAGVLFMGDYDLGKFGPWYGDRDSDIDQTIDSVRKLQQIPAAVRVTGHEQGYFEEDADDHWDRYLAIIDERESKLLACLAEPRTMEDIVNQWIVYRKPREPKGFFEFGERALMSKHLERLKRRGAVAEDEGRFFLA